MRDLQVDIDDAEFNGLLVKCTEQLQSRRPSSLKILEISRRKLAEIMNTTDVDKLLPDASPSMSYLSQALVETLDRLFKSCKVMSIDRAKSASSRIRTLIDDSDSEVEKTLGLQNSIFLAIILEDEAKAIKLIGQAHRDSENRWKTYGITPLHLACLRGFENAVSEILERLYPLWLESQTDDGSTPLHFAAANGHMKIYEMLLNKGADSTVCDFKGVTASCIPI
jgi:hypothetical protein